MLLARLPFPPCVPSTNRRGDPDSGLGAIFARGSPSHRSQGSTHVDPTVGSSSSVFRSISFRRQLSVRICPPRYRPIDVHSYSMCLGPDHVADAVQAAAVTDDLLKADVYFLTIRTVSSLARTVIQWANRAASAASDTRSFTCTIRSGGCGRTLWASQRKVSGCVVTRSGLGECGFIYGPGSADMLREDYTWICSPVLCADMFHLCQGQRVDWILMSQIRDLHGNVSFSGSPLGLCRVSQLKLSQNLPVPA